jgi:hypothetical protein
MTTPLKSATAALTALALAVVSAAADVLAAGAIRPDHEQRFGALRVSLDQLHTAAAEVQQLAAAEAPPNPDAEAFAKLSADLAAARSAASDALASGGELAALVARIETLALTVDHMSDQLSELVTKGA